MVAPGTEPSAEDVVMLARERTNDALVAELTAIAAMITRDGKQGVIPRDMLAGIVCPVHVLWGAADPVLPVSQSEDLPPHFKVRLAEGVGHMLVNEATGAVLETLAAAKADTLSR
jgi:pyruvate dehydrogenase E2 component (dihydrolipoamide acetyltransferase)